MDFKTFFDQAWEDHATDARAVAERLAEGTALVTSEPQVAQLVNLAHHVHGEHLGQWQAGIDFIEGLSALPFFTESGASGQGLRRGVASLRLSAGERSEPDAALSTSDRIRVGAMAAASLAERDTPRAMRLFREALDLARSSGLGPGDPMNHALAVTGNNLAAALEEKSARSADERELMLLAALAAREYWERAGTWLETERAEYRLAMSYLQAADLPRAREHALACLSIVGANDGAALERFFGWEALALVEQAGGNPAGRAQAVASAREAFAELDEADKPWCAATLEKLAG